MCGGGDVPADGEGEGRRPPGAMRDGWSRARRGSDEEGHAAALSGAASLSAIRRSSS